MKFRSSLFQLVSKTLRVYSSINDLRKSKQAKQYTLLSCREQESSTGLKSGSWQKAVNLGTLEA